MGAFIATVAAAGAVLTLGAGGATIAACCNYPDECYVLVAKKLGINVHKKEFTKQVSSLDIGASVLSKNETTGTVSTL